MPFLGGPPATLAAQEEPAPILIINEQMKIWEALVCSLHLNAPKRFGGGAPGVACPLYPICRVAMDL